MNFKLTLAALILFLSGCAHEVPLLPEKNTETKAIHDIQVTFIIPKNIEPLNNTINGIDFLRYQDGTEGKIQKLDFNVTDNQMIVERRTDNGVAGSGIIYDVDLTMKKKLNNIVVTFKPVMQKPYQEGLVLPFPVPQFDIKQYLVEGVTSHKFELESAYPPETVKANLQRLLGDTQGGLYIVETENERITISAEIYPYKHNQSKIIIRSKIMNTRAINGTINVAEKLERLKKELNKIVNS